MASTSSTSAANAASTATAIAPALTPRSFLDFSAKITQRMRRKKF